MAFHGVDPDLVQFRAIHHQGPDVIAVGAVRGQVIVGPD